VRRGEQIGIAGCTGSCTGTHLHFELRYDGIPVDPTFLMVG
jgi:murein DD-endopeptidase MepM/ murein hydrolase activator NlpD